MRTTKHTPGPWTVWNGGRNRFPGIEAIEAQVSVVVWGEDTPPKKNWLGVQGKTHEEALANARLIAAAPELLDALQGVMRWWMETPSPSDGDDTMPAEVFDAAINALAKAGVDESEGQLMLLQVPQSEASMLPSPALDSAIQELYRRPGRFTTDAVRNTMKAEVAP